MLSTLTEYYKNFANFLDQGGTYGWIAASVMGFILFWPIGLFLIVQMFMRGYAPVPPKRNGRFEGRYDAQFERQGRSR